MKVQIRVLLVYNKSHNPFLNLKHTDRNNNFTDVEANKYSTLKQVAEMSPDIVVIYSKGLWQNTQIISLIRSLSPRTRVICIIDNPHEAARAILLGATGYEYIYNIENLSTALSYSAYNRAVIDRNVAGIILNLIKNNNLGREELFLSVEEYKILSGISQGIDSKTLESRLGLHTGSLPYLAGILVAKLADTNHSMSNDEIRDNLMEMGIWKYYAKDGGHFTDSALRRLLIRPTQEIKRVVAKITGPRKSLRHDGRVTNKKC